MFDPNVTFTFPDDQLFTFPADPEQRLYTSGDLFKQAAVHILTTDPDIGDEIAVADIISVLSDAFAAETVIPVISL